jgi:hypothetical protein
MNLSLLRAADRSAASRVRRRRRVCLGRTAARPFTASQKPSARTCGCSARPCACYVSWSSRGPVWPDEDSHSPGIDCQGPGHERCPAFANSLSTPGFAVFPDIATYSVAP